LILGLVAFLAAPLGAAADDAPASSRLVPAPLATLHAPGQTEKDGLCREEIFEVLKGGAALQDPLLLDHLWQVAGSLACRNWSPPRVTIRVVVSGVEAPRD
jgi:hypothetical protein